MAEVRTTIRFNQVVLREIVGSYESCTFNLTGEDLEFAIRKIYPDRDDYHFPLYGADLLQIEVQLVNGYATGLQRASGDVGDVASHDAA